MTLEDAQGFNKNMYALTFDFTSAFDKTDHDQGSTNRTGTVNF